MLSSIAHSLRVVEVGLAEGGVGLLVVVDVGGIAGAVDEDEGERRRQDVGAAGRERQVEERHRQKPGEGDVGEHSEHAAETGQELDHAQVGRDAAEVGDRDGRALDVFPGLQGALDRRRGLGFGEPVGGRTFGAVDEGGDVPEPAAIRIERHPVRIGLLVASIVEEDDLADLARVGEPFDLLQPVRCAHRGEADVDVAQPLDRWLRRSGRRDQRNEDREHRSHRKASTTSHDGSSCQWIEVQRDHGSRASRIARSGSSTTRLVVSNTMVARRAAS